MKLQFSVAARDRKFSKAMQRIDKRFVPLVEAFESVSMVDPIHQAILVLITDDKDERYFSEVANDDGYFQLVAGVSYKGSDEELFESVFAILRRACEACPFSNPDRKQFDAVFDGFRSSVST